jgi:hypothetical protein
MDKQTATTSATSPLILERAASAAREKYPEAVVKVIRGRVVAVEGDLIRLVAVKVRKAAD